MERLSTSLRQRISTNPTTSKAIAETQWAPTQITFGTLQRPKHCTTWSHEPKSRFQMFRQNCKIETNFWSTRRATTWYFSELRTRAGSSLIKSLLIPRQLWHLIRPLSYHISLQDPSKRTMKIASTMTLFFYVGTRTSVNVTFKVVNH